MIDHNVVRLDITMHDAFAVAEVESLEELVYVEANVVVLELGVQTPKVGVVHILENQRRCFTLCIVMLVRCRHTTQTRRNMGEYRKSYSH